MLLPYFDMSIPAGFPSPALDYTEERIDMNDLLISHPLSTFLIRVKGQSMQDAFIPDNALLVVDRSLKAVSGTIVVAVVNGEFTIKRLIRTPRNWVLHPENSAFKPLVLTPEMNFQVWGVVTKIIIDAK